MLLSVLSHSRTLIDPLPDLCSDTTSLTTSRIDTRPRFACVVFPEGVISPLVVSHGLVGRLSDSGADVLTEVGVVVLVAPMFVALEVIAPAS